MINYDVSYPVSIKTVVNDGFGLAYIDKKPVFVSKALPGDHVDIEITHKKRKHYFGKIKRFISPSPLRNQKGCIHFDTCGGCHYQDISYENQLKIKYDILKDTSLHSFPELVSSLQPIVPCSTTVFHRNKMDFAFGESDTGIILGLKAHGSFNTIIPISDCQLLSKESNDIVAKTVSFFSSTGLSIWNSRQQTGCLSHLSIRHSKYKDQYMVNIVASTKDPLFEEYAHYITSHFSNIVSVNVLQFHRKKGIPSSTECHLLWGEPRLIEKIRDVLFYISPLSFFQTNSLQVATLYDTIRSCCTLDKDDLLLDLYCGTGTIGLYLSYYTGCTLIGIEEVESAICDANDNAALNHIQSTQFIHSRVKNSLKFNTFNPDCIVVDPPRSGMVPKALRRMAEIQCKNVIYVSCNPVTLIRDLKELTKYGYSASTFIPVDMFPHSYHLESIVKLTLN